MLILRRELRFQSAHALFQEGVFLRKALDLFREAGDDAGKAEQQKQDERDDKEEYHVHGHSHAQQVCQHQNDIRKYCENEQHSGRNEPDDGVPHRELFLFEQPQDEGKIAHRTQQKADTQDRADALPVHARPSFRLPEVMRNTTSAMLTFTI